MKKKILLGVLSVLAVGFSFNSFSQPKNVSAELNNSQTSMKNVQLMSDTKNSDISQTLFYNETEVQKSGSAQQSFNLNSLSQYDSNASFKSTLEDESQLIVTELEPYGYPNLIIQKGVPFKWVINVTEDNLNGCNNEIIIDSLGISKVLEVGENIIEFTPTENSVISYSCWMGMQTGTIAVVDDISNVDEKEIQNQIRALPPTRGCCG